MKIYEKLDKDIIHICRKAEKNCKPTVSGKYQWPPVLATAIKTLAYWRARKRYGSKQNRVVKKLEAELGAKFKPMTEEGTLLCINKSRDNLRTIQQNDIQHRREHLEELATK